MKRITKSRMTLFSAIFVAVMAVCLFPAKKVSAASIDIPSKSGKTICNMITDKKYADYGIYIEDLRKLPHGKNMKVLSFKSNNTKVIKAWTEKSESVMDKSVYPMLKLKKPGTAKLTLTYKSGSKNISIQSTLKL